MTSILSRQEAAVVATGRSAPLFDTDIALRMTELRAALTDQRVLVIGGAGSIGAATVAELSRFELAALHVVDTSENGLAELVRDLRGRPEGLGITDFRTLPLDVGTPVMRRFIEEAAPYGLVLNFAALKHVRSEKDAHSLLQMLDTNVLKALQLLGWLRARGGTTRYFSVSTDKAANPVNLMGASKRLMEHAIFAANPGGPSVTSARFANVAFSAGSLLEGWLTRLEKRQPLAVPRETRRYFLSLRESGQLCLLASVCGAPQSIMIPRLDEQTQMVELEGVARALLQQIGLTAATYTDESAARTAVDTELARQRYPLLLTPLDTSGEKAYEEFVGVDEIVEEVGLPNLRTVGYRGANPAALDAFVGWLQPIVEGQGPTPAKAEIVERFATVVPELRHVETNKLLDQRL